MKPRVFLLMTANKDIKQAERYGRIELIYGKDDHRPGIWTDEFVDEALHRLAERGYDANKDFVLIAGSMVPMILFCSALACECMEHGTTPRVLCFDVASGEYIVKRIGWVNTTT